MVIRDKRMRLQGRYITFHTVTKMLRMDERKKERQKERKKEIDSGIKVRRTFFSYWRHPIVLYYIAK